VLEGELHLEDCEFEECRYCGGAYVFCDCAEDDRVPFVMYPQICARCGEMWPDEFTVPDEEWAKYVPWSMRECVLCRRCYKFVKAIIDSTPFPDADNLV